MVTDDIKSVLARVVKWPKAAQLELVQVAREIEDDLIDNPRLIDELAEAHREALQGDGSSLEEVKERLL